MNIEPTQQPIIITCKLENTSAIWFNKFRQQHFPPAKNFIEAHLTLFHHIQLPAKEVLAKVEDVIDKIKPFNLLAERIAFTGRGVAFIIKSRELIHLHKRLQQSFKAVLTPQDSQALWPHITIQNKTTANESKVLAAQLQQEFKPFAFTATGLQLFYYMNGPWQFIADVDFK